MVCEEMTHTLFLRYNNAQDTSKTQISAAEWVTQTLAAVAGDAGVGYVRLC